MQNWKITYLDYSGNLVATIVHGSLYDVANFYPNNSSGNSSIIKVEKIPNEV